MTSFIMVSLFSRVNSPHSVKNSVEFIHVFGSVHAGLEDLMLSFIVVSFISRVLGRDAINLLGQHFEDISWHSSPTF